MAITYYTSADGSAPTLSGTNGSLLTLLDAILVNGYGAKTAAGWSIEFTATNKRVYRPASGTRFRLRILDDGSPAAAAREAVVRAAESASDVDTLVDPFPTVALVSNADCVWRKSDTADSTARSWWCVANDSFFMLHVKFSSSTGDFYCFGDLHKLYSSDSYACILSTRNAGNNSSTDVIVNSGANHDVSTTGSFPYFWMARTVNGVTKSEGAMILRLGTGGAIGVASGSCFPYPGNGAKLVLLPLAVLSAGQSSATQSAANKTFRGYLPYAFEAMCAATPSSLAVEDVFTASAYDASSSFVLLASNALTDTRSRIAFQTAGTFSP